MWRSISLVYNNIYYSLYNTDYKKKDVFVLGQGWLARGFIEHIDKSKYTIINITKNNFVNLPLILSTIKNQDNQDNFKFKNKIDVQLNEIIVNIDIANHTIKTENKIYYFKNDYVVVGLGTTQDNGDVWSNNINSIKNYKTNSNVCVIGSGPTGTELAFYLNDLGHQVSLIDIFPKDKLYGYLSTEGKKMILNRLEKKNIKLIDNTNFDNMLTNNFDYNIKAFVPRLNILTKDWKINSKLQLISNNKIYAGGDCILQSYPPTAQVAYQQGKYIAEQLNGTNDQDFQYTHKGIALYVGNNMDYVEMKLFGKDFKLTLPSKLINYYKSL